MAHEVSYAKKKSFYDTIRRDSGNLLVERFMSVK